MAWCNCKAMPTQSETAFHTGMRRHTSRIRRKMTRADCTLLTLACNVLQSVKQQTVTHTTEKHCQNGLLLIYNKQLCMLTKIHIEFKMKCVLATTNVRAGSICAVKQGKHQCKSLKPFKVSFSNDL